MLRLLKVGIAAATAISVRLLLGLASPALPIVHVGIATAISIVGIASHEGLVREPYIDVVGMPTYCYGETSNVEQREYTKSECLQLLARRVYNDFEVPIAACTASWDTLPLATQASSISFAYNIGVSGYCRSTTRKQFDAGNVREGCEAMLLWTKGHVNGELVTIQGLVNRRMEERDTCLEGVL